MTETHLYLTRHGETEWNVQKVVQGFLDSPLTEHGRWQATMLGQALVDVPFAAIHSSSSGRARDTAALIAGSRNIPIELHDDLREICQGTWQGRSMEDIEATDPERIHDYWHNPAQYVPLPGGESFVDVRNRAVSLVESLIARHRGESVLIVTHGVTLKLLMAHFSGQPLERLWDPPYIHSTSTSHIIIDGNRREVVLHGDMSHLETSA